MKNCNACGAVLEDDILECPCCGSQEIVERTEEEETISAEEVAEEVTTEDAPEISEDVSEETPSEEAEESVETEKEEADESAEASEDTEAESEENTEEPEETDEESDETDEEAEDSEYDDEEYYEERSLSKKTIGIIIGSVAGALAVIVGVICLFTFVDFNVNLAYGPGDITFKADEDVTGEAAPVIAFVANTPYEMTENFTDYQIKIKDAVYKVPMPVKEILDSGWAFGYGEDPEKTLNTGETNDTFFISKDGAIMYATIINFYDEDAMQNECYVSRIKVDFADNEGILISIMGDLPLGSTTRTGVEQVIGETDDVVVANGRAILTYDVSETQYAKLMFEKKTEKLISVEYFNSNKPYDFQNKVEETTAYVGYTEPVEVEGIGKDIMSGYVEFEGDVYKLPIVATDLQNNGWELALEEDRWLVYPDESLAITITRGDKVIKELEVYNGSEEDKGYPNCEIVSLSVSDTDDFSVVFPNNIKAGMTEADFLKAVGNEKYTLYTTNFNEYIFSKNGYDLIVVADKDEKIVTSINMYYDGASEE